MLHRVAPSHKGNAIQITGRIGMGQVDRWRGKTIPQRKGRDGNLGTPRRIDKMANHRLDGTDANMLGGPA